MTNKPASPVSSAPAETPLHSARRERPYRTEYEAILKICSDFGFSDTDDVPLSAIVRSAFQTLRLAGGVAKGDPWTGFLPDGERREYELELRRLRKIVRRTPPELIEAFIEAAETYRIHSELTSEHDVGVIDSAMMKARDDLRRALSVLSVDVTER